MNSLEWGIRTLSFLDRKHYVNEIWTYYTKFIGKSTQKTLICEKNLELYSNVILPESLKIL